PAAIRVLAADASSRTSVQLARILLARRYNTRPQLVPFRPDLGAMLEAADAALIIGDPALRVALDPSPYQILDLGSEWTADTGLPMVFAVWGARKECFTPDLARPFLESCRYGLARMDDIVREESRSRDLPEQSVREYFARNVVLELGEEEYQGLHLFLRLAGEMETLESTQTAAAR
ncbi:MAG TPA: MqnA/MqnD/SBP family protein, partial [Bryobacteraceae bacterium]|nr:MqnA/MqnD/SBP family protein [Bryobacteraceae bacterium]